MYALALLIVHFVSSLLALHSMEHASKALRIQERHLIGSASIAQSSKPRLQEQISLRISNSMVSSDPLSLLIVDMCKSIAPGNNIDEEAINSLSEDPAIVEHFFTTGSLSNSLFLQALLKRIKPDTSNRVEEFKSRIRQLFPSLEDSPDPIAEFTSAVDLLSNMKSQSLENDPNVQDNTLVREIAKAMHIVAQKWRENRNSYNALSRLKANIHPLRNGNMNNPEDFMDLARRMKEIHYGNQRMSRRTGLDFERNFKQYIYSELQRIETESLSRLGSEKTGFNPFQHINEKSQYAEQASGSSVGRTGKSNAQTSDQRYSDIVNPPIDSNSRSGSFSSQAPSNPLPPDLMEYEMKQLFRILNYYRLYKSGDDTPIKDFLSRRKSVINASKSSTEITRQSLITAAKEVINEQRQDPDYVRVITFAVLIEKVSQTVNKTSFMTELRTKLRQILSVSRLFKDEYNRLANILSTEKEIIKSALSDEGLTLIVIDETADKILSRKKDQFNEKKRKGEFDL